MILQSVVPSIFQSMRPGSTILAVRGYHDKHNGVSDFALCFHASYHNAIKRSIAVLQGWACDDPLAEQARQELIASYNDSLTGSNPRATSAKAYEPVFDCQGMMVPGVKWHTDNGELHLWGFRVWKRVIIPGEFPTRNRRPLTVAKDVLRQHLPTHRFRQFILTDSTVDSLAVENHIFTAEDMP